LTAVATELSFGDPAVVVKFVDGSRRPVAQADLADYVTEARNPGNERGAVRVEVRGRWPLLEPGVVLVDTPGIGSVYRHNTEAAHAALLDADGAVLVLSADTPLSDQERDLVRILAGRRPPTFVVLNKADHLSAPELEEVRRFVDGILSEEFGRKMRVFAVSALAAVKGRRAEGPGEVANEFAAFVAELRQFIEDDLVMRTRSAGGHAPRHLDGGTGGV
jgi:translation elongation factor EF-Tu-like GTPase